MASRNFEAKLDASGRQGELRAAMEKKEMFAKLLERWSLYASAQQIFVHLLARAEHEFNYNIYPKIESLQPVQVNELVTDKIVSPIVNNAAPLSLLWITAPHWECSIG